MGYVGATVELGYVRSRMNASRNAMKKEYARPKMQRFCNDPEAFNWACRCYRYFYELNNGNMPNITADTFAGYYDILTDTENYRYIMSELKEDPLYRSAETRYLIEKMRVLRQRYR